MSDDAERLRVAQPQRPPQLRGSERLSEHLFRATFSSPLQVSTTTARGWKKEKEPGEEQTEQDRGFDEEPTLISRVEPELCGIWRLLSAHRNSVLSHRSKQRRKRDLPAENFRQPLASAFPRSEGGLNVMQEAAVGVAKLPVKCGAAG